MCVCETDSLLLGSLGVGRITRYFVCAGYLRHYTAWVRETPIISFVLGVRRGRPAQFFRTCPRFLRGPWKARGSQLPATFHQLRLLWHPGYTTSDMSSRQYVSYAQSTRLLSKAFSSGHGTFPMLNPASILKQSVIWTAAHIVRDCSPYTLAFKVSIVLRGPAACLTICTQVFPSTLRPLNPIIPPGPSTDSSPKAFM